MTAGWYADPTARTWRCQRPPSGVTAFHAGLPGYAPTRLVEMPDLATELGVGRVFVKDESARFGLPAFKVLGASWAVVRVLSERLGRAGVDLDELRALLAPAPVRLVAATDGNHGRAVARMASLLGLPSTIVVPPGVTGAATAAIAGEGAIVETVEGTYDDAIATAAAMASQRADTVLVQDTGFAGYEQVPGWIAEGYDTLFAEVDDQLATTGSPPVALVAVPVGVGSLAQAAVAHYRGGHDAAPTVLSVEPTTAACVLASLTAGAPTSVPTSHTLMAGLNCGTPSTVAWPYLRDGVDAAVAVTDDAAVRAVHDLTAGGVAAGPCGGAPLAGVRAARDRLDLAPESVVVLVSTEGIEANPID